MCSSDLDGHVIDRSCENSGIDGGGVVNETTVTCCLTECSANGYGCITISSIKDTGIIDQFKVAAIGNVTGYIQCYIPCSVSKSKESATIIGYTSCIDSETSGAVSIQSIKDGIRTVEYDASN